MRKWLIYTALSAVLVIGSGALASVWLTGGTRWGVWTGLGTAWIVQSGAFAALLFAVQRRSDLVLAGWTAGTVLRLATLGLLAWLTLGEIWNLPPEPTLIALVSAIFGLLLLEPVVFRRGREVA